METRKFIGIEIGGTKLQIVIGTSTGDITTRHRFNIDRQKGASGIRQQIESTLPLLLESISISAIGVGFGGPLDWKTGQITQSHQIEGWSEFPLGSWLSGLCGGIPCFVENDANVACLAETHCGAARDADPAFYVTMGSGVGGGLTCGGKIYHGARVGEFEIGHLRLNRQGETVESRCSGWAVNEKIQQRIQLNPTSDLATLVKAQPEHAAQHLGPALLAGDDLARDIISETAADLAFALSHVIHLAHPSTIVLGGGLSLIGTPLLDAVTQELTPHLMSAFHPGPKVVLAQLDEDTVTIGALLLAGQSFASLH